MNNLQSVRHLPGNLLPEQTTFCPHEADILAREMYSRKWKEERKEGKEREREGWSEGEEGED